MNFTRIIPRDLFNESKLLKSIGQLALKIHEGINIRWPMRIVYDGDEPFIVNQNPSDGDLFCTNLNLFVGEQWVSLSSTYNSKSPYPLCFSDEHNQGNVFDDNGEFSIDFCAWLDSIAPELLTIATRPGKQVYWSTLGGVKHFGVLKSFDNGTAIVTVDGREEAVRCV